MGLDNPLHIIFLLLILVLVFGAKRLPEMGRSLGEGLRGFKDGMSGPHAPAQTLTSAPETQVAAPQVAATEAASSKVPVA